MIVTCNECESSFNVDDGLVKDSGSKVRCSKCSSVFVVYPEAAGSEMDQASEDLSLEMGDELPDLDEMMDFDDEELVLDSSDDDDSDLAALESDDESLIEMEESELGHLETDDNELPELDMDMQDLEEAAEADSLAAESDFETTDDTLSLDAEDDSDELDLSDLEDLVGADDDMVLEDVSSAKASETDLDLDMDMELDSDEIEPAEAEAVVADDGSDMLEMEELEDLVGSGEDAPVEDVAAEDEGDLDLDLDLDLDAEPEADMVADDLDVEPETASIADDLDVEPETASVVDDLDIGAEESDELDLSDLEGIIEPSEEPAEESENVEALDDLGLELDIGEEAPEEAPVMAAEDKLDDADELDFSDLEGIIDEDQPQEAEASDDLELEFEVDEGAVEAAPAEAAQTSEELDIDDLEKMLESDEKPTGEVADELELDLDLEPETADAAGPAGSDDAEFLDIEKMLEGDEDTAPAAQAPEEVVELDLEAVMDEAAQDSGAELDLNLDMSTDLQEADTTLQSQTSGEEDLDFNLLESDEETLQYGATQAAATQVQEDLSAGTDLGATSEEFSADDFAETRDFNEQTDTLEDMDDLMGAPVKKRSARKPLMAVVLILFLCLVGIIVTNNLGIKIPYVSDIHIPYVSDVKIPYLSGLMGPKVDDVAGNLKITPMSRTISYKFVDNNTSGKILVISGQVRNEYDHPRSNIKVTGKIYSKGKNLANTATVYAGNKLSDADLKQMDMSAISKRLQNRFGDKRSNVKVQTGKTIPFIIVFNQLPAGLDEYTVEVAGSSS